MVAHAAQRASAGIVAGGFVVAAATVGCRWLARVFERLHDRQAVEIVKRAIAGNPKAVADYKKGKTKAADAIKGAVMRETKGMAKTEVVQQIVMEELQKA